MCPTISAFWAQFKAIERQSESTEATASSTDETFNMTVSQIHELFSDGTKLDKEVFSCMDSDFLCKVL